MVVGILTVVGETVVASIDAIDGVDIVTHRASDGLAQIETLRRSQKNSQPPRQALNPSQE